VGKQHIYAAGAEVGALGSAALLTVAALCGPWSDLGAIQRTARRNRIDKAMLRTIDDTQASLFGHKAIGGLHRERSHSILTANL